MLRAVGISARDIPSVFIYCAKVSVAPWVQKHDEGWADFAKNLRHHPLTKTYQRTTLSENFVSLKESRISTQNHKKILKREVLCFFGHLSLSWLSRILISFGLSRFSGCVRVRRIF